MSLNTENSKKTPLYESHVELKGRMVSFAGWNMPVQYSGLVDEHKHVRSQVGLFDVSHMGEINVTGRGSLDFLQKLTINDISKTNIGQAQYNAFCYPSGTLIDDIIIYRRGFDNFFICVNASNIDKDYSWLVDNCPKQGVHLENLSQEYAQIAVQGPKSRELVSKIVDIKIDNLPYYHFSEGKTFGIPSIIARTGYTGELGFELYIPAAGALKVWNSLLDAGQNLNVKPCGLGARDTLRLEVGFLLYGNDMDDNVTALECGLNWITKFEKGDFTGKEALLQQKQNGLHKKLVGFEMCDKTIARHGYKLYENMQSTNAVGIVTSGSPSPTLSKNIGLGYVPNHLSQVGTNIFVEIRGERKPAQVVKKLFYVHGTAQQ
ncbi:MAG: glycine cleavage system aminomethyltransferase GcvT [Bdellovibrionota bacterium]